MRFAERFLVLFALISLILRLSGAKDGATLELIAMPLLAAFYLIATPFYLYTPNRGQRTSAQRWLSVLLTIIAGAGIAYSIISLMLYTLGWLPKQDMAENTGIILSVILMVIGVAYRKTHEARYRRFLLRICLLISAIGIACLIPFSKN